MGVERRSATFGAIEDVSGAVKAALLLRSRAPAASNLAGRALPSGGRNVGGADFIDVLSLLPPALQVPGEADQLLLFFLLRWLASGLPVFRPTPGLFSGLILTDPGERPKGGEPWPFPAFAIELPEDPPLRVELPCGRRERGRLILFVDYLVPEIEDVGYSRARLAVATLSPERRRKHALLLIAPEGTVIHQHAPAEVFSRAVPESVLQEGDRRAANLAGRGLVNLTRWVAERGMGRRVVSSSRLRARARSSRPGAREPVPEIWEVGCEVKLGPELLEEARTLTSGARERARWRVRSRFCVRGHWRRQACGVGRKSRRLRWIAPHWKGPREGTRLAHLYSDSSGIK